MAGRHHARRDVYLPPPQRSARAGEVPKVPAVKPYFWVVKLLTTAMGEAVSDLLVQKFNPYLAVIACFLVFAVAITWQFRVPGYRTWPYWLAVAMVAVFGTMMADALHVGLGVPYVVSAAGFAIVLALIFAAWYQAEGTLSIHSVCTPRREFFYWATVCATFAMGTAVGDLTAQKLHWGYLVSGFAFTFAILIVLAAWRMGVNPVLTFWVAYILTRPVGASFADFFGMPVKSGGLGIGHEVVSAVTVVLVIASFGYLSRTGIDAPVVGAAAAVARWPQRGAVPPEPGWPAAAYPAGEAGYLPAGEASYLPAGEPGYLPADGRVPQAGDPRYGDPRHGDPRYDGAWRADPRYGDAWRADPGCDGAWRADPGYGGAWRADPR